MARMVSGNHDMLDGPTNILVGNVPPWFPLRFGDIMCLLRQMPQKDFLQSQSDLFGGQYVLRGANRGNGYGKSCRI